MEIQKGDAFYNYKNVGLDLFSKIYFELDKMHIDEIESLVFDVLCSDVVDTPKHVVKTAFRLEKLSLEIRKILKKNKSFVNATLEDLKSFPKVQNAYAKIMAGMDIEQIFSHVEKKALRTSQVGAEANQFRETLSLPDFSSFLDDLNQSREGNDHQKMYHLTHIVSQEIQKNMDAILRRVCFNADTVGWNELEFLSKGLKHYALNGNSDFYALLNLFEKVSTLAKEYYQKDPSILCSKNGQYQNLAFLEFYYPQIALLMKNIRELAPIESCKEKAI